MTALLTSKYYPTDRKKTLNQVYNVGWEFSLMSKVKFSLYKQVHQWATCKDYVNDLLWSHYSKKPVEIYGFTYNTGKDVLLDMAAFRVATRHKCVPNKEFEKMGNNALTFLNYYDKKAGLRPCRLRKLLALKEDHKDNAYTTLLFEADKRWMNSAPLVSFYMLMMRLGFLYSEERGGPEEFIKSLKANDVKWSKEDLSIMKTCIKLKAYDYMSTFGHKLFSQKPEENFNFKKGTRVGTIHDFGFKAWAKFIAGEKTSWDNSTNYYPETILPIKELENKFKLG